MKDLHQQRQKGRHPGFVLVLLCFLPVLAINFAYNFLEHIDFHWQELEQHEVANQEIEALAVGSEFSYQFARHAGQFSSMFQAAVASGLSSDRLADYVNSNARRIFRSPFPDYELFAFYMPEKGKKSEMLFMQGPVRPGRLLYIRAFEHLVRVNRGEETSGAIDRQNEKLLARIIQSEAPSDVMAKTQRGRASFAFYQFFPHWFLWDYFETPGQGCYGFFLFSRNDEQRKVAARLLALRDLRERSKAKGAFIPLYSSYGGAVLQEPLQRSGIFKSWAANQVATVERDLARWLQEGIPPAVSLGRYQAYSYLGKSHTHLSVLLMPELKRSAKPLWFFLLNLFSLALLILLLMRGLLLGQWPELGVRLRFLFTYLLIASMPISLLVISVSSYVTQYRQAVHFQSVSGLQSSLRQFDARKAQINDEYLAAFAEMAKDRKLQSLLLEKGAESMEARDRILSFFEGRDEPLPLLSFAVFDENGKGVRYYSGQSKKEADPVIEAFRYPITEMLRRKIAIFEPDRIFAPQPKSSIQQTSLEAYRSMTKNDLVDEVDKRRSFAISRQIGNRIATQIHELIKIDGQERFAVFLIWDDQALDSKIFQQTVNHFALNSPEYIFLAYRVKPQRLDFIGLPGRDVDAELIECSRQIAEQAYFRGSYVGSRRKNLSLVAIPAKKYASTVLVGATRHHKLEKAVARRLFFLAFLLLVAVLIVFFCAYLSARIILDPITGLRSALDRVAAGNQNIEIASHSLDELGVLCQEFSSMTRGLREREKLAALLSDQAIEAISRSDGSGTLSGESFSGVALVSDIRNFTGLCEEHSPAAVTEMLNEHFAAMTEIITGHGGRIYKFIGDAIAAVFPQDDAQAESSAERAFKAAVKMIIRLRTIDAARQRRGLFTYRIGVGLAFGEMHSGATGSLETRLDYAIIGEPLQVAAQLESISAINPQFPLVIDAGVKQIIPATGFNFNRLENSSHLVAYNLVSFDEEAWLLLNSGAKAEKIDPIISEKAEDNAAEVITVAAGHNLSARWLFALGVLFVIFIAAGCFFGWYTVLEARKEIERSEVIAENLRLIEQLKCKGAYRNAFEANGFNITRAVEEILQKRQTQAQSEVSAAIRARIDGLSAEQGRPSRVAVFLYDKATAQSDRARVEKILYAEGWNDQHLEALAEEANWHRQLDYKSWNYVLENTASPVLKEIFGNQITDVVIHRELFGRASEIPCDGKPQYFYWDYLTEPVAVSLRDKGVSGMPENRRRVVGTIMLAVETSQVADSLPMLVSSYQQSEKAIAILSRDGSSYFSDNFPPDLSALLVSGSELPRTEKYIVSEDFLGTGKDRTRLLVCHFAAGNTGSLFIICLILLPLLLMIISYWWRTVRGQTPASSSLAARLWLLLLLSAVVPLLSVVFVFNLFLNEDYSVRISQARDDLNRKIDLFELRESFVDPLAWKFVRDRTFSRELRQISAQLEKDAGPENMAMLERLVDSWYLEHAGNDPLIINFNPRDIAIAGKGGWEYASSGIESVEANEFGVMLKQIARGIMRKRSQEPAKEGIDTAAIEGDLVIETGLHTVRSLFGDDVFVKLAHGVGLPVLMHVVAGTAGLIIHAVPSIEKPEYVMIWLIMFDYEGYLARIAEIYRGEELFWPVEGHRYGNVLRNKYFAQRHDIVRLVSWIASGNLPVAGQINYQGRRYLVESRPGVSQMTSLLLAMTPESPIDQAINASVVAFILLMSGILICIIIVARTVADDIMLPVSSLIKGVQQVARGRYAFRIESRRSDELGSLCIAFDRMARGLEEKMLMGKMLSQSAQKFSLQETEVAGSKVEFAMLYIGIPSFASWMEGAAKETLFADLRAQIALIASIIMQAGGDVDKIIGEKVLAVFHAGKNPHAAVAAACRSALQIAAAESSGALPFPVAIGVNYGSVIAGFLGVGSKRDFTIIGDAVNVTSRIENVAENMRYQRCLASERMIDLLPPDVLAREYGEVELKGKTHAVRLYRLSSFSSKPGFY